MSYSLFWKDNNADSEKLSFQKNDKIASRFKLIKKLGKGGFGEVWEAKDIWLSQNIALKISYDDLKKETLILRRLPKDSYISIFDYVRDKQLNISAYSMELLLNPWVTLEEYNNDKLRKYFSNSKELYGIKLVVLIAINILRAISVLHGKKYSRNDRWCHGDIKPLNLYINLIGIQHATETLWWKDTSSIVKIGDLGLAKEYGEILMGGTRNYMAPEQTNGNSSYPSTDIFSIGQTLTALITGNPFKRSELQHINRIRSLLSQYISNPYLVDKLSEILRRMTMTSPVQRPNANEVISYMANLLDDDEWKILECFLNPEYKEGLTLSDASYNIFDWLSQVYNWRNRNTERLDMIKNKVRNMYKRNILLLEGHKYRAFA